MRSLVSNCGSKHVTVIPTCNLVEGALTDSSVLRSPAEVCAGGRRLVP